jgi:hypothetical protein
VDADERARWFAAGDQIMSALAAADKLQESLVAVTEAICEAWIQARLAGLKAEITHSTLLGHVAGTLLRLELVKQRQELERDA